MAKANRKDVFSIETLTVQQALAWRPKTVKGTVARDFLPLVFFHELTPYGPLILTLKYFRIRFRIRGDIRIRW
jgi:hypothetical protein